MTIEMKCPYCNIIGGLTTIHRHTVDAHLEMVQTKRDKESAKLQFTVACPFCDDMYQRQVKPRNRNPKFLEEFKTEIALVAFDQMLYHILENHPQEVGVDPAELGFDSD